MTTTTKSWTKILSNPFAPEAEGRLSPAGLILLGVIAGLLHVHLRYPLNIPGHHGLEWMAVLLFGRSLSTYRFAAGSVAAGAATSYLLQSAFLPLAHEVKPVLIFLLSGFAADIIYLSLRNKMPGLVTAGLTGSLAFITKPAVMYSLYLGTGMHVGMFVKHPDYLPFVSHFLFGLAGGTGGYLLARMAVTERK